ncbi:hypothetical protein ASE37_13940 [Rhizobium sp. Root268]|nr:hypothetical protein ASC86_13945 [Rhizobium sp. Root1212]KRD23962.1 hypothetical protein ASE37_13940 [Rhizobium sp. Root268]
MHSTGSEGKHGRKIGGLGTGGIALVALAAGLMLPAASAMAAQCSGTPAAGIDWHDCNKKNVMMPSSDLQGANLANSDFSTTDFSGSNLNGANLEKATIVRTWFEGASAEKANFSRVEAYRSNFAKVAATGANFAGAELQRANFAEAVLNGVDFEKAELGRVNFDNATLADVRFAYANLSRAVFSKAAIEGKLSFEGAFMFLTRIEDTDLSGATGLEQEQIDMACGNAGTKLPQGLTAPTGWPCPSD